MDSIGKQTIVTILAGQVAPVEVLQLMLDKKPKQFGFTVQGVEGDAPDLSTTRQGEAPTLEQLIQLNDNTKEFNLHLYFGYLEGKVDDLNIQPFLCTGGNDMPYMSVMVEGVFSKHSEPKAFTEERNLFDNFIYPEIEEVLELTDGDFDKMLKHMSSDRFNKKFLAETDHRSVLHILPLEGDPITNFKNELGETYPWGYMSQRHGYGDVKQEPAPAAAGKQGHWWKKGGTSAVAAPVATKTEAKQSVPTVQPKKEEAKKDDDGKKPCRPPAFIHSNSDIKAWYTAINGSIPGNWKKRIPVMVKDAPPEWSDLKDFQAWVTSQKVGASAPAAKTDTAVLAKNKETLSLPKNSEQEVSVGTGVLLNKKELAGALDYVAKHLDGQSTEIPDPKTAQSTEAKVPTLSETLAFDAVSYLNWPKAALFKFFHEHPTAGALAFIEVRDMLRPHVKVTKEVKEAVKADTIEKVVTTETKSGEGTTHVSSEVVATGGKKKWWDKAA